MSAEDPFGWDHEAWVKYGWCPVISKAEAWCHRRAGHGGQHMTPRVHPDDSMTREYWDR